MELHHLIGFWTPSFPELVVVLILALLLFGKRLPEVARSLGKGIVEFKKGVRGIEDEVERAEYEPPPPPRGQIHSEEGESAGAASRPSGTEDRVGGSSGANAP